MMAVKFLIGLLAIFALVSFAVNNQQDVVISYYFDYEIGVKLWVAILASFILGGALASIAAGFSLMKEKSRRWKLARQNTKLEEELNSLKQKPMPDEPSVYATPAEQPRRIAPAADRKSLPPAQ